MSKYLAHALDNKLEGNVDSWIIRPVAYSYVWWNNQWLQVRWNKKIIKSTCFLFAPLNVKRFTSGCCTLKYLKYLMYQSHPKRHLELEYYFDLDSLMCPNYNLGRRSNLLPKKWGIIIHTYLTKQALQKSGLSSLDHRELLVYTLEYLYLKWFTIWVYDFLTYLKFKSFFSKELEHPCSCWYER